MGTADASQQRMYSKGEQERISFYGHEIIAVRLDDGRIVVTMRSLCEGMNLDTQAQTRRAERTEALAGDIVRPWLDMEYGPQEVVTLTLTVLPGWLLGVDTTRLKGDAHDTVLAYQREAYGVLYRYFAERTLALAPSASLAQLPAAGGAPAGATAEIAEIRSQIADLYGVANLLQEHLAALLSLPDQMGQALSMLEALATRQDTLGERQDTAEGQLARIDERTQRLTPAHARAIQEQVDQMVRATKRLAQPFTHAFVYGRLKHRFRASTYKEIADEQYPAVMAYLHDELRQARDGQGPEQGNLF